MKRSTVKLLRAAPCPRCRSDWDQETWRLCRACSQTEMYASSRTCFNSKKTLCGYITVVWPPHEGLPSRTHLWYLFNGIIWTISHCEGDKNKMQFYNLTCPNDTRSHIVRGPIRRVKWRRMVQKERENKEPSCLRARRTRLQQPGPECMCSSRPTTGGLGGLLNLYHGI